MGLLFLTASCRTATLRTADSVAIPVYYATDRKALMPLDVWQAKLPGKGSRFQYYGGEYEPTRLEFGVCAVNVPAGKHRTGVVERSRWPGARDNPKKHFAITTLKVLEPEQFFAEVNGRLVKSNCGEVFVFIPGYNLTFSTATLYTSQLAWDWGFRGVPILYSWPSDGTLLGYPKDEESVRLTEGHLRFFLKELLARTATTNVHLIAHSLGNRALIEVLKSYASGTNLPMFKEVILAAPDVNRVSFQQEAAEALPRVAERVTLYVSGADKALQASKSFHQFPRAGDAGTEPVVCDGIDTIDTSTVEADLLGHSYMLRAPPVLADMADVICRGLRPEERKLIRVNRNGREYWKLDNAASMP